MTIVGIVSYGMGNIDSVMRAIEICGANPRLVCSPDELDDCHSIILPGVGSFRQGIANLTAAGLVSSLHSNIVEKGKPFLGICLGMQMMAKVGYEDGVTNGLDWVPGEVKRLVPTSDERIPHIGWNEVWAETSHPILDDIPPGSDFYFVHSFCFETTGKEQFSVAYTPYCGKFISIVARENMIGVQFHPEKSQRLGFQLLKNFLRMK